MEARDPSGLIEDLSGRTMGQYAEASRPNENYQLPPWPGGGGRFESWSGDEDFADPASHLNRQAQSGNGGANDDDPALVACRANPVCDQELADFTKQGGVVNIRRVGNFPEWFGGCRPDHRPCSELSRNEDGSLTLDVPMLDTSYAWDMLGSMWGGRVDWAILLTHELAEANGTLGGFSDDDAHHYALLVEALARNTNREYYGTRRAP